MSFVRSPVGRRVPPLARVSSPLTRAERRARTADLLEEVAACTDPDRRRRLLVAVTFLNLTAADSVVQRYHHPSIDRCELLECARQALLRAVTDFRPAPGADLLAEVVPVVRRAAQDYVRSHRLASVRCLYAARDRGGPPAAYEIDGLADELDLDDAARDRLRAVLGGGPIPDATGPRVRDAWRQARALPPAARWLLCLRLAAELSSSPRGLSAVPSRAALSPVAERVMFLLAHDQPEPEPPTVA